MTGRDKTLYKNHLKFNNNFEMTHLAFTSINVRCHNFITPPLHSLSHHKLRLFYIMRGDSNLCAIAIVEFIAGVNYEVKDWEVSPLSTQRNTYITERLHRDLSVINLKVSEQVSFQKWRLCTSPTDRDGHFVLCERHKRGRNPPTII